MPDLDSSPTPAVCAAGMRRARIRRRARLALCLAASLLMAMALFGERGLLALRGARDRQAALAAAVERLRHENARLRRIGRQLREDPAAIEAIARGDLGLARPGEVLFIIRDVPSGDPADAAGEQRPGTPR